MELLRKFKKVFNFFNVRRTKTPGPPFLIVSGGNIEAGKESYHNGNFKVKGVVKLRVGSYCAFGQDIKIILTNHNYLFPSMQYTFYIKNFGKLPYQPLGTQVNIGNDVWIGDNVIILPGVTIGDGCIIGGGAIVTKDVAPYSIVAGNPAKVIKKRFSDEKIEEMLMKKWWEWSDEEIKKNSEFFFKEHF